MSDVDLDELADRLYALPPEEFTAARDDAVKLADDAAMKKSVKALRKPTAAAHVVNALVRDRSDDVDELLGIGADLRTAMRGDPKTLRTLTERRRELITDLVDADLSPAVQQDVTATLEAATADPQVADAVRSGRLVKPLRYAGFGAMPDLDDAVATPVRLVRREKAAPTKAAKKPATKPPAVKKQPPAKQPPKKQARTNDTDPGLAAARQRCLDLPGKADDAQRRYELAVKAATQTRKLLEEAEAERAEAHREARSAHAEAERARREVGRLERS